MPPILTYQNPPSPTATLESVTRPDGNVAEVVVIGDPTTNTNATVKNGVPAVSADPALVVTLSPNNGVKLLDGSGNPISSTGGALDVAITGSVIANNNITEWASTTLGAPTAYGTAPSGIVIGVNAFVTNFPATQPVSGTIAVSNFPATQPVSGTITANQGGAPWSVTFPSAQAVTLASTTVTNTVSDNLVQVAGVALGATAVTNFGTAPAAAAVPGVNASLFAGITPLTQTGGALNVNATFSGTPSFTGNITEWNSVALGSPSAYGTSPGAVNVIGVNAFITNTPAVTLVSTTITGTVAVTQSTSPWVVSNSGTFAVQSTLQSGSNTVGKVDILGNAGATLDSAAGTPNSQAVTIQGNASGVPVPVSGTITITPSGTQNVNLTQVAGTVLAVATNWGTAASGEVQGVNAELFAGNTALAATGTSLNVDVTNTVPVTLTSTTITGTVAVTGTFFQATQPVSGTVAVSNFPATQPVSGTVAVTQSTSPWIVAGGGTAGSPGTAVLTVQGISGGTPIPVSGTITATIATPTDWGTAPSTGTLVPAVNSEMFVGQTAIAAVSNYGTAPSAVSAQGVNAFITNTVPVTLASTTITGTVAVTQSTSPWVSNITQWASVALGAPSNYGTSPGAVEVPGVNAFVTNTVATTLASTTITGTVATTIPTPTNWGTAPATSVAVPAVNAEIFGGQVAATVKPGSTASVAADTSLVIEINPTQPTAMFSGTVPGTAPANTILVGEIYNTSAPTATAGQTSPLQADYVGSQFVKPYRRSQTVGQATTIASSSSATTVLAAQAAGVFADVSSLIITATPALTTALVFTATLSDGTNSYIFDMDTGTIAASSGPIILTFNPPLPATSAATVWTIALSVATVTVHVTVVAVLQKAS